MTALDNNALTLLEFAKQLDPSGDIADVAHLLNQTNRILDDAIFMQANEITTHQVTVETGLPEVYWRQFNQGIQTSVGRTAQVKEPMGMLEARSQCDIDLAMLNGNTAAWRLQEARRFLEAMNQEMASALFYSDPAIDPKKPLGFAPRYSDLSAGNAQNILDAGGGAADDLTSIYLMVWGPNTIFCPFPKGSTAGLVRENLGRYTAQNVGGVTGAMMEVFGERFQWKNGLCVKDWRYGGRICNIDVSDAIGVTGTQDTTDPTNFIALMIQLIDRIPSLDMGTPVFYVPRVIRSALAIQALRMSSNVLAIEKAANQIRLSFMGIPIKLVDAISIAEDQVT